MTMNKLHTNREPPLEAHRPDRHGGAYSETTGRVGPTPDYGFVVNARGHRVPAGPDGKPTTED